MAKRHARVKLSRAQHLENERNRWMAKKDAAIAMLVKAMDKLKSLDRSYARMQRLHPEQRRIADKLNAATQVEEDAPPKVDDGIPTNLRRQSRPFNPYEAEQKAAAAEKTKGRIAKMKAKQTVKEADLNGERKKMPLSGKAALEAIRGKRKRITTLADAEH